MWHLCLSQPKLLSLPLLQGPNRIQLSQLSLWSSWDNISVVKVLPPGNVCRVSSFSHFFSPSFTAYHFFSSFWSGQQLYAQPVSHTVKDEALSWCSSRGKSIPTMGKFASFPATAWKEGSWPPSHICCFPISVSSWILSFVQSMWVRPFAHHLPETKGYCKQGTKIN